MNARPVAPTRAFGLVFAGILALALTLRLGAALVPGFVHPDELFQYLEQAHRNVFGYGIVPLEYRYGMRGWLLPLALGVPMRLGDLLAPGSQLYLLLPRLLFALLSMTVVLAAYRLGARLSRLHGLVAMAAAATWYEIVFYGAHIITEAAAVALILPAAVLLLEAELRPRAAVAAGLLLGFAAILRFQYLPAIAVFVVMSCGTDWRRRWLPLLAGGAAAAIVSMLVDLAMGQQPFSWMWASIQQNLGAHRAAGFGVSPPWAYVTRLSSAWSLLFAPILLLLIPVARHYRALLAMAAVNLIFHSAIAHKEYRFILLSVTIAVIVAAIGSADLLQRHAPRLSARQARFAPALLVLAWAAASAALVAKGGLAPVWREYEGGSRAMAALRPVPGLCGVALVGVNFWESGGYTYLHRAVPLYVADSPTEIGPQPRLVDVAPAFNGIVAPAAKRGEIPPAYRQISCSGASRPDPNMLRAGFGEICAFVRQGGCDAQKAEAQRLDRVMARQDW